MRTSTSHPIPHSGYAWYALLPLFALVLALLLVLVLARPDTAYADQEHCGEVPQGEVWLASQNVHLVTCDVIISANSAIQIQAGAIVKFAPNANIIVRGRFLAQGTAEAPIYFTSIYDDSAEAGGDTNGDGDATTPAAADWGIIEFMEESDDTSIIRNVVLRYGGAAPQDNISQAPIMLNNASPILEDIAFESNFINAVGLRERTDWETDVWDNTSVVYWLQGSINIPEGNKLTINPGMRIKVNAYQLIVLRIAGELDAAGTADNPIYFTSIYDDSPETGGDTNNDGAATTPALGDWGQIIFLDTSAPTSIIEYAVIRYSGGVRRTPVSKNLVVDAAPIVLINASPILKDIDLNQNYYRGVEIEGDQAWRTDTWNNTSLTYLLLDGTVTIPQSNTLTIAPGMIIKAGKLARFVVDGKLIADGTRDEPISFTSLYDDTVGGTSIDEEANREPGVGDWGHILFTASSDDTSSISRAVMRYSGGTGQTAATGSTILLDAAVSLENASPRLANITFTDNFTNAVHLRSSEWYTDTLDNSTVIYVIEPDDLRIPATSALTIASGVKIKLDLAADILVDGKLLVNGTADAPVRFVSAKDDSVCGIGANNEPVCDTNNDGDASSPAVGDWGSVRLRSSSEESRISYAAMRHSGSSERDPTTRAAIIEDAAIVLEAGTHTIRNTLIVSGYNGIEVRGEATPELTSNNIYGNANLGVLNLSPETPIDAANHWWGSTTGPTHPDNPDGTGQAVGDGVLYTPWAEEPVFTDEPPDNPANGLRVFLPLVLR